MRYVLLALLLVVPAPADTLPCPTALTYAGWDLDQLPPPLRNFFADDAIAPRGLAPTTRFGFAGPDEDRRPTHRERLGSLDELNALAKSVRSGGGEQKVVKLVYRRQGTGRGTMHFIDTNRFRYHYEFATGALGYRGAVEDFNRNYTGDGTGREYNLASLVLSPGTGAGGKDELLLELWSGDTLAGPALEELYRNVATRVPPGIALRFHPLSEAQERMVLSTRPKIPVVTTRELYQDRTYWPLNEAVSYGYLKFVDSATLETNPPLLDLTHIAVFDRVPNDIGLVGGVITEELQTPLSHVNVKSMNRGTANMSLRDAKRLLKHLEGKPVKLTVGPNGYQIEALPPAEADRLIAAFWDARKPKLEGEISSRRDERYRNELVRLGGYYQRLPSRAEHQDLIRLVGAKAANLALMHQILGQLQAAGVTGVRSPDALGVSFDHFDELLDLRQEGLDPQHRSRRLTPRERILEILNREKLLDGTVLHPVERVRPALEEVRAILESAEIPEKLIALFKRHIMEDPSSPLHYSKNTKIRLRSSTNSEDLEGFTGAGLYNSDGVRLYTKKSIAAGKPTLRSWKKIERDLRKALGVVYSSVWNERAFYEREWFSIQGERHLAVKVGIAVHTGFPSQQADGSPGELGNGVAISQNFFNQGDRYKLYINGQHYDLAVTNPPTPERLRALGERTDRPYRTEELLVTTQLADPDDNERPDAWMRWPYERLRASSIRDGAPVLSDPELRKLALAIRVLSDQMAHVYGKPPSRFAIDVEWKLYGRERTLYLKQARPFERTAPR